MKCKDCPVFGCQYRTIYTEKDCYYGQRAVKESFDWQSLRAEAAKDILCAIISQPNLGYYGDEVESSITFADKLIAKLKEKEEK